MLRQGKEQGWLTTTTETLSLWARTNGVEFNGVSIQPLPGKGLALVATEDINEERTLLKIPNDLILSLEFVRQHAKIDGALREVLDAAGDYGMTTRGAVLLFLLTQITRLCPDVEDKVGVTSVLGEYIKILPIELLPTFWSDNELELLTGTSLKPATQAKTNSLYREFDMLRESTASIPWCQKYWWNEIDGLVGFDDWRILDCFYRSRALEFPGIGDAMVPCIDMANHASGEATAALYEADGERNGLLLLRKAVKAGDEITITYGDEKGACEMLFSYGFLEDGISARDIQLDLQIPQDDPLRQAKLAIISVPSVRLIETQELKWESEIVWLACVNEEDGLGMHVVQTVSGEQELQATWDNSELDVLELRKLLKASKIWEVYLLRAITLIKARIEARLEQLTESESNIQGLLRAEGVREQPRHAAVELRRLELGLLQRFSTHFEQEQQRLYESRVVQEYLGMDQESEDFS